MFRSSPRPRIDDFVPFTVESRGVFLRVDRDNEDYSLRVTPDRDELSVLALTELARSLDLEILPEDECAPDVEEDGTVTFWMYDTSIEALRPEQPLVRNELRIRQQLATVTPLRPRRGATVAELHARMTGNKAGEGLLSLAAPIAGILAGLQ